MLQSDVLLSYNQKTGYDLIHLLCIIIPDHVPVESSQQDKAPEQGCSCGAGSCQPGSLLPAEGAEGGGTPGRVSAACLSHSTHSPLESSARVNPTPDVAFLSPTAQVSSKCFPSPLLRLLRHTASFT